MLVTKTIAAQLNSAINATIIVDHMNNKMIFHFMYCVLAIICWWVELLVSQAGFTKSYFKNSVFKHIHIDTFMYVLANILVTISESAWTTLTPSCISYDLVYVS